MVGEVTVSCTQSGVRGWGLTSWFTSKEYKDVNLQDTVTNTNVIYGISLVRLFSHSQKALSHPSTLIIELNIVLVIVVFLLASGTYLLHVSPCVCVLLRFPRPEIPSVTVVLAVWWCMRIVNFRGIIFTFPHYESICVGGWHSVKMMLTLMIIKCSYTNNTPATLIRWKGGLALVPLCTVRLQRVMGQHPLFRVLGRSSSSRAQFNHK